MLENIHFLVYYCVKLYKGVLGIKALVFDCLGEKNG
jgi:hypothetical protein